MTLRTRKPTGRVPWPLILLEGGEKSGKSYAAAAFSGCDKVGQTYWLDLSEGAADEYGAIPGARYEVIEHNGSWADIFGQVEDARAVAAAEQQAGRPPVVLVIDSMTAEWDLLKSVADKRARDRLARKHKAVPEHEEVDINMDIWNVVNERHRKLMNILMTFPGIVIMIARGKEVAALDASGRPINGRKDYKVEGHKNLAYDASAWVRLSRDEPPKVVGVRSVHAGVRPGIDKPVARSSFSLEWLVFDLLKCVPGEAQARDLAVAEPERTAEEIAAEALLATTSVERLRELHKEANALGLLNVTVSNGEGEQGPLASLIALLGRVRSAQGVADEKQHRHMHALWRLTDMAEDRDARLKFTAEIIGRPIRSSNELTAAEANQVIARLNSWLEQNTPPAGAAQPNEAGVAA